MQRMKPPERSSIGRYVMLMVVQSLYRVEVFVSDTELRSSDAAMKGAQTKPEKSKGETQKTMQH